MATAGPTESMPERLREPLVKVLGARTANALARELGLETVGDLLRHYPRRYMELGELTPIDSLPEDEPVSLVAEVKKVDVREMKTRRGKIMNVVVTDGHGMLDLTFFNNVHKPQKELKVGRRALFSGKVSRYRDGKQLAQPMYELLDEETGNDEAKLQERLEMPLPIYPATGRFPSNKIRDSLRPILDTLPAHLPDPVPAKVRMKLGLIDLTSALRQIHRPGDRAQLAAAQRRLKFEEAFILQSLLVWRKAVDRRQQATPRPYVSGGFLDALDERLPFELTEGQKKVGEEIAADLGQEYPMHRLLQGEVGSGKTLVALRAMARVVDSGGQAALLAPTEVLAMQHHRSMTAMLGDLAGGGLLGGHERGTRVTLLTGSMNTAARRKALLEAASGEAGIVVGTHALIQETVQFSDLGLVVVDEQHRFGVEQRDALRRKGENTPHLLVMTATPIPRTVAMTVFGDLETSVLDQLPAGRSEIVTHVVPARDERWLTRTWQRVAEECRAGHQAYVVCARIGSDEVEEEFVAEEGLHVVSDAEAATFDLKLGEERRPAAAVLDVLAALRVQPELDGLVIEMLHGRMPADEREEVMRRFAANEIHVLVATTVIEVGVDVPNATAMVITDADRFGVSQLHQLRGRVGRGRAPGICLLLTDAGAGVSRERLQAVASTRDGFELARIDLETRREGDVLGSRQSGVGSSLKLLRVLRDEKVIAVAREEATLLLDEDVRLRGYPELIEALRPWVGSDRAAFLDKG
ncbi:ATP-dependent DNA helicase RecG [Kineosporia rhizophila]|uniref:ATP-dependent DNA helicase RecG n=1 Tax=Kineosporia TaxID=49184 RepID=UPI001E3AF762|nr:MULTISPECIES: ATP-dependent DNA helicase RecG [Kineosporia]MCE0538988.1 ATP-dependent DNA helicase RecG [Kineosporia rhizophila]GLY16149.1 ATP-dependent DNA helicase RecG [Kineosporia sp. NBRC 101677]